MRRVSSSARQSARSRQSAGLCALLAFSVLPASGCPTVDLGEEPVAPGACRPDPAYFETIIWPEFIEGAATPGASCIANAGCHDANNNGRSSLRFQTATPINFSVNYDIISRFLNCSTPTASAALTKPQTGVATHGGGDLFAADSAVVQTFLMWFDL